MNVTVGVLLRLEQGGLPASACAAIVLRSFPAPPLKSTWIVVGLTPGLGELARLNPFGRYSQSASRRMRGSRGWSSPPASPLFAS
jgi:hypothetical protein